MALHSIVIGLKLGPFANALAIKSFEDLEDLKDKY